MKVNKLIAFFLSISFTSVSLAQQENAVVEQGPSLNQIKFSGYIDTRYTDYAIDDDSVTSVGRPESGFGIEDGALYLNYSQPNLSLFLDIPFRRAKVSDDLVPGTTTATSSASNNSQILLGGDKAQVFGKIPVLEKGTITIGQFDTIYGVELNDSKDRVFGRAGLINEQFIPLTHTGVLGEYQLTKEIAVKALAANPNNKGSYGDVSTGGNKTESGGAVAFSNERFRALLGYIHRSLDRANGQPGGSRQMADFLVGGTFDKFSIDLEYTLLDDASKNTLTPSDSSDKEKVAQGYLVLASYKMSEPLSVHARYEKVMGAPSKDALMKEIDSYGIATHYQLNDKAQLRAEYVAYQFEKVSDARWQSKRVNLSSLFYF